MTHAEMESLNAATKPPVSPRPLGPTHPLYFDSVWIILSSMLMSLSPSSPPTLFFVDLSPPPVSV